MTRKIVGIYLAAGLGTRLGQNKLLMPFSGATLGAYALTTALNSMLHKIIVVVSEDSPLHWLPSDLSNNHKLIVTCCKDSYKGQSHSIKFGVKVAKEMGADSIVILLADQPFVSKQLINQLISCQHQPSKKFIAATKREIICPPVLINQIMFSQILQLSGDHGAKRILELEKDHGMLIEVNDRYELFDIDTRKDYDKALLLLKKLKTS